MKRMLVPALALGLAFAIVRPALAGHLFGRGDGCCESTCDSGCARPRCFSGCRSSCSTCETSCSNSCDPCGGHHFGSRLRGIFRHGRCDSGCNTCNSCNTCSTGDTWGSGEMMPAPSSAPAPSPAPAPAPMPTGASRSKIESNYGTRLQPIPSNTSTTTRTIRRSSGF
jgi:hypothetical protein